jgi:hypothetical protein
MVQNCIGNLVFSLMYHRNARKPAWLCTVDNFNVLWFIVGILSIIMMLIVSFRTGFRTIFPVNNSEPCLRCS